jgi:hypothetical protein
LPVATGMPDRIRHFSKVKVFYHQNKILFNY